MKWVKILLISSLAVLQFSACSLDSNDEGMSVARMKDGSRGLPVPAGSIPNIDVQNTSTTDWGRVYSSESADIFRQKVGLMMATEVGQNLLLGTLSPLLESVDGTGVAFKGKMNTASALNLISGAQSNLAYLDALKSDPSKMQFYMGVFDSYVGQWANGTVIEPYSFYFGALNTGYNGQMAFNYQVSGSSIVFVIYMADQYGEIRFDGSFPINPSGTFSEGVLSYKPRWQGSGVTDFIQIGNFKIGTCNLFKCS